MKKIVYILLIIVGYVVLLAACAGSHGAADTYQLHNDINQLRNEIAGMKEAIGTGLYTLHTEIDDAYYSDYSHLRTILRHVAGEAGIAEENKLWSDYQGGWNADIWKEVRGKLGA